MAEEKKILQSVKFRYEPFKEPVTPGGELWSKVGLSDFNEAVCGTRDYHIKKQIGEKGYFRKISDKENQEFWSDFVKACEDKGGIAGLTDESSQKEIDTAFKEFFEVCKTYEEKLKNLSTTFPGKRQFDYLYAGVSTEYQRALNNYKNAKKSAVKTELDRALSSTEFESNPEVGKKIELAREANLENIDKIVENLANISAIVKKENSRIYPKIYQEFFSSSNDSKKSLVKETLVFLEDYHQKAVIPATAARERSCFYPLSQIRRHHEGEADTLISEIKAMSDPDDNDDLADLLNQTRKEVIQKIFQKNEKPEDSHFLRRIDFVLEKIAERQEAKLLQEKKVGPNLNM